MASCTTVEPDFSVVTKPITAVTGQGVSPIVITSNGHGLNTGDQVQIDGVQGNLAANGSFVVTRLDANRFELTRTAGNGVYLPDSGVWYRINTIAAVSNLAGPIKITSQDDHGLNTGDRVLIEDVQGNAAVNGTFTITQVSATEFTLNGTEGLNTQAHVPGTGRWRSLNVAGMTGDGALIQITTATLHNLAPNDQVWVEGVAGNQAANGLWTIDVVDNTHFTLRGSLGNGAYTADTGSWTKLKP